MRKIVLPAVAIVLAIARPAASAELPPETSRQADRYAEILAKDPAHELARERLWKIYRDASETPALLQRYHDAAASSLSDGLAYGYLLLESGNAAAASEAFQAAAKLDETSPLPWIALAAAGDTGNDPTAAADALTQALDRLPDASPDRTALLIQLGERKQSAGNSAGAATAWEEAIAIAPGDVALRRQLVDRYTASGNSAAALPHLEWLAANAPAADRIPALVTAARLAAGAGDFSSAITSTSRALDLLGAGHWQRPVLEQRLLDLHAQAGTLDTYLAELKTSATASPRDARAQLRLAAAYACLARHDEQLATLRKSHATLPLDAAIAQALLEAEADFGDLAVATTLADSLIAQRPDDRELVFVRSDLDVRAGQIDDAAKRLETLMAAAPSDKSLAARCLAFFQNHQLTDAIRRHLARTSEAAANPTTAQSLARLDFAAGSPGDGARTLLATDFAALGPEAGAAAAVDAAALLREQGLLDEAITVGRQAVALDPKNSEVIRTLSSALAANGKIAEAEAVIETAVAANPDDTEALDRHLLQLLESTPTATAAAKTNADLVESLFATESATADTPTAATRKARELRAALGDAPAPSATLRLARWQEWSGQPDVAAETLASAIARHPDSAALHEAAARLAAAQGDIATAIEQDESFARLAPAQRDAVERRIAGLEADRGNFDRALEIFKRRAADDPSSVDALIDLAGAQQRANDWYRALDTWVRAFAAASPAQRAQMRQSVLAVVDRLALPAKGVSLLATYAAGQPDDAAQIAGWEEAVAFAVSNQSLGTLRSEVAQQNRQHPQSYPLAVARATIEEAAGQPAKTFAILSQSLDLAGDQSDALQRTLRAALASGDNAAAIRIAARLAASDPTLENWQRLASLQETQGEAAGAVATWRGIQRRFSRDPDALTAAADFYQRQGRPADAAASLYAAAGIEPATPGALAAAGHQALAQGDRDQALRFFRQLLAITRPLTGGVGPLPGFDEVSQDDVQRAFSTAMRAIGGLSDPDSIATVRDRVGEPESGTNGLRLEAIRAIARLSRGGSSHEEWLTWCRAAPPREAVWGFYETAATREALDQLAAWSEDSPDPGEQARREQAFIWIALRGGEEARLRNWIDAEPENRRRRTEFLFLALSRLFQSSSPSLDVAALFPAERVPNPELWQAAWLLAAHSQLAAAAALGDAALPTTTPVRRAAASQQLASWHLLLQKPALALAALDVAIEPVTSGYDQPEFSALRMKWLLSDDAGRQKIRESITGATDLAPTWRAAANALLAALSGEDDPARQSMAEATQAWLAHSYGSDFSVAFDEIVRSSVIQSLAWQLPQLALALCDEAAKVDPAVIALRGGNIETWSTDLELSRTLAELMTAPPREARFILDRNLSRKFDATALATLARQLEVQGNAAAAVMVRQLQRDRDPSDPTVLSDLIGSAIRTHDDPLRARLLAEQLDGGSLSGNFQAVTEQTCQLSDLLVRLGDPKRALTYLDRTLTLAPADPAVVRAKDRALAALGDTAGRIVLAQSQEKYDPPTNTLALARLLVSTGRESEATAIVENLVAANPSAVPDGTAIQFAAAVSRSDLPTAARLLRQMAARDDWARVCELAPTLATAGDSTTAITILREGLASATRPEDQFACGASLLTILPPPLAVATIEPILVRTRAAAENSPALTAQAHQLEIKLAKSDPAIRDWLHDSLAAAWNNGAGDRYDGEKLIQLAIDAHDTAELNRLLDQFLVPKDTHPVSLAGLAELLTVSGDHLAAARVYGMLASLRPGDPAITFNQARELWRADRAADAEALVEPWARIRWFDPEIHAALADFYASVGANDRAAGLYSEIVATDSSATKYPIWTKLARLARESNHPERAALFLQTSFANPENTDWQAVVDHLVATTDLATLDPDSNPFHLRDTLWSRVRIAIAAQLVRTGHSRRALQWLTPASLLDSSASAVLLDVVTLRQADLTAEAAALWEAARSQLPDSLSLRHGHSRFLTARAQSADESVPTADRLAWLASAFEASPDLGPTAQVYASLLRDEGRTTEARKVLETLILTNTTSADRAEARETLRRWAETDGLPPGGQPS